MALALFITLHFWWFLVCENIYFVFDPDSIWKFKGSLTESSWLEIRVYGSWIPGPWRKSKIAQSKQVWQLAWKKRGGGRRNKWIMGICQFHETFGFSKLSNICSWFDLYYYWSDNAWCADPWWIPQMPIYYKFWSWDGTYARLKSVQRPDRLYKCVK